MLSREQNTVLLIAKLYCSLTMLVTSHLPTVQKFLIRIRQKKSNLATTPFLRAAIFIRTCTYFLFIRIAYMFRIVHIFYFSVYVYTVDTKSICTPSYFAYINKSVYKMNGKQLISEEYKQIYKTQSTSDWW